MLDPDKRRTYQSAEDAIRLIDDASRLGKPLEVTRDGDIAVKKPDGKRFFLWFRKPSGSAGTDESLKSILATKMKIDLASASSHAGNQLRRFFDGIEEVAKNGSLNDLCTEWVAIKNRIQVISAQREAVNQRTQSARRSPIVQSEPANGIADGAPSVDTKAPDFGRLEKTDRNTRANAIAKELIRAYKFQPDDAALFAKDMHAALTPLKCSFRDLRDFRMLLLDRHLMPKGLTRKAELSAALAILQQMRPADGPINVLSPDEAALQNALKIVNRRIAYLPVLQAKLPHELRIDCVHEGATHAHTWEVLPDSFGQMNEELKSQEKYPPTKDANILKTHPQLGSLEEQFGKDFARMSAGFRVNGKIDRTMSILSADLKKTINAGKEDEIERAKTAWLNGFLKFFGNDNAAGLASYYMSQTILGSLFNHWIEQGNPLISPVGDRDSERFEIDVDMVGSGPRKKCIIEARSVKNGYKASIMLPARDSSGALVHSISEIPLAFDIDKDQGSIEPSLIDQIRVELDFAEMSQKTFNPKILEGRLARNIRLDWRKLDEKLE